MKLHSIKKTLAFSYVLARYNRRSKTKFRALDIAILFILDMYEWRYKRNTIIDRLKKFRRTVSYTLLNKRLKYLIEQNLVVFEIDRRRAKRYSISVYGKILLQTIETKIRAFRIDKLKY